MSPELTFRISTTRFDEHYAPSAFSRVTTNFANLARGEHREQNLSDALTMMNNRFRDLMQVDSADTDRYVLQIDIVSVDVPAVTDPNDAPLPLIELLDVSVVDQLTGQRIPGIVGNSFSSYIRDYDFSILLPAHAAAAAPGMAPVDFGQLHGDLFQRFVASSEYAAHFSQPPVICISVSTKSKYHRLDYTHPVLGAEYEQDKYSLTDQYFAKMGLNVRFFMPPGARAPLAFYTSGDLSSDYSDVQLAASISTMESFQKIYRPEIYNANSTAGKIYQPTLEHRDFSLPQVGYDRDERTQLGIQQGHLAQELVIDPLRAILTQHTDSAAA